MRGRRLARELRRLREDQKLTLQEVADRLGWSRATVSRLETGQTRPRHGDVADLLDLYGVTSPDRDALITLARETRQRGWWTGYADVFTGSYVALEDGASHIRSWDPQLVHGLLQTEAYSRAVISSGRMIPDTEEIDRRVAARKVRQGLLDKPDAPRLHMIIDEGALRRQIGGAEAMADQLRALVVAAERPNVTIQVLSYEMGANAGLDGRFTLLSYPDPDDPDIAYVEGTMGNVYLESTEEIGQHVERFRRIRTAALSPEESIELISHVAKE